MDSRYSHSKDGLQADTFVKFLSTLPSASFVVIVLTAQLVHGALEASDELIPEDRLRAYARHQLAIAPKMVIPSTK